MNGDIPIGTVMLENPVDEDLTEDENNGIYNVAMSRNISWEYKSVTLQRVPGYGFGIAVSGGSDNPHFANGDPAIAISDVLKGGPAENKLCINDRILTANGIKLENVDYGTAVQVLRDSGPTVNLIIKRRIINQFQKIHLNKITLAKLKHIHPSDYGVNLVVKVFVKDSKNVNLVEGDEIVSINGLDVAKLFDFRKAVGVGSVEKLEVSVVGVDRGAQGHRQEMSYDSGNGNLYVCPPTKGRKRELPEVPVSEPTTPANGVLHGGRRMHEEEPPRRPPLPAIDFPQNPPRYLNFLRPSPQSTPLGLKLSGGNWSGLFISAVQAMTPAASAGLLQGDLILKVNDQDFSNLTREEAIDYLSKLKENNLISFIVRYVENWREILKDKPHDLLHVRVNYDCEVKAGTVVKIVDTVAGAGGSCYEGVIMEPPSRAGQRVELMNGRRAVEGYGRALGGREPYTRVRKERRIRPIQIYSNFTEYIYEKIVESWGGRAVVSNEIVPGKHCLLSVRPKELTAYEGVLVVGVKTEDKMLLKKGGKGSYGSLLRSFNKSQTLRKQASDLNHTLSEAPVYKTITVSGEDWFSSLNQILEDGLAQEVWVRGGGGGGAGGGGGEEEISIPNYNLPPPYALTSKSSTFHNVHNVGELQKSKRKQIPLPLADQHQQQNGFHENNNHFHEKLYNSPTKLHPLAHSPMELDPGPSPLPLKPPPSIDRSKKPPKPIPPPKPKPDSYYLNLPINSKSYESAFEPYKRLSNVNPNVTSGQFSSAGGVLSQKNCGGGIPIQVIIPEGAIPPGRVETIWFRILEEKSVKNGIISPLVKFGPENLHFLKPVEIRIPQYSRSSNASVLMSLENREEWSRVKIDKGGVGEEDFKVVSLSVGRF